MVTIYELLNIVNQKAYVGSTSGKLNKRMREHRCLLRAGKHSEPELQADWITYGEAAFIMKAVMQVEHPQRAYAEVRYMDAVAHAGRLYNTKRFAYRPPPGASNKAVMARVANGYRPSPESNMKRRLSQLGKPKRRKHDEIVSSAGNKEPVGFG